MRALFFSVLIFTAGSLPGQGLLTDSISQDSLLEFIFNQMEARWDSTQGYYYCLISIVDNIETKETQEINIVILGNKFHIKSDNYEVYCNGIEVTNYQRVENSFYKEKYQERDAKFLDHWKVYPLQKDHSYQIKEITTLSYVIELIPHFEDYTKLILEIDKSTFKLKKGIAYYPDGENYRFEVTKFEKVVPLANDFEFNPSKYPEVWDINLHHTNPNETKKDDSNDRH